MENVDAPSFINEIYLDGGQFGLHELAISTDKLHKIPNLYHLLPINIMERDRLVDYSVSDTVINSKKYLLNKKTLKFQEKRTALIFIFIL
jgi:hypothetical protein